MNALPSDARARKAIPVYSGFVRYFPKAMAAVAELSRIGNDQHNPGEPLHWNRAKSGDELDACMRHLMEAGTIDDDGVRHSTKAAWRAMANLEKELEASAEGERPQDASPTAKASGASPGRDARVEAEVAQRLEWAGASLADRIAWERHLELKRGARTL